MKKFLTILTLLMSMCFASLVMAIDFDATGNVAKAYTSNELNQILTEHYGMTITTPGLLPNGFAKYKGNLPVYNDIAKAWRPEEYHKIFRAYNLVLQKENVEWILGYTSYCIVLPDGQIKFANGNFAYTEYELDKILSLYYERVIKKQPKDTDRDGVVDELDLCPNTPIGAKVNTEGCWVINNKALFTFDNSIVNAAYLPVIEDIADVIRNNIDMIVVLGGHTDSKGSEAYNQKLSERRAMAVKSLLVVRYGIRDDRIDVEGFGETQPIASNATAEGRSLNRRVELSPIW